MPRERQRARTAVDRVPRSLRPDGATQRQREGRCSLGDGLERTASGRQLTAGRGTTARRGDAAATSRFVQPRERPQGGGGDHVPPRYGPKGRRNGGADRCSHEENHGAAALRPDGATQRQLVARSAECRRRRWATQTELRSENRKRRRSRRPAEERKPGSRDREKDSLGQPIHGISGRTLGTGGAAPGAGDHGIGPGGGAERKRRRTARVLDRLG
jgi:hypothetical protein